MAQLTISEAIRQSGIGRTKFYKMINSGKITPQTDSDGKKYIDSSDLERVFPDAGKQCADSLEDNKADSTDTDVVQVENGILKAELKVIREQVAELKQDKEWLKNQNDNLLLRLEAPTKGLNPIVKWWRNLGG